MSKPPIPVDEKQRLENLREYDILDSGAEQEFDDIVLLVSQICQTPISLISLIDFDRQWFKSRLGMEAAQGDRESAFCAHAINGTGLFIIPDAQQDERFADNPLVTANPHYRFYAGAPLVSKEGHALGTLCVIDRVPRQLSQFQIQALEILGKQVVSLLSLRRTIAVSRAAELEIKVSASRLSLATRSAKIGVWDWDLETDVLTWDATMFEHYGLSPSADWQVAYATWANAVVPEDLAEQEEILLDTVARLGQSEREFRIIRGDGARRIIHAAEAVVFDEGQKAMRVVGINQDVTEARQAEAQIRHISLHDALTGLPNRILFADRVDQALQRMKRDPARHFAVLFIDLDRFKVINDSMGHAAGDDVLKTIAERLRICLRNTDSLCRREIDDEHDTAASQATVHTVARMGGDEFTLMLDGLTDPRDVVMVADRLLAAISEPIRSNGHELISTASIGIVNGSITYTSSQELLRDADAAMYQAKSAGKARFVVFDTTMHAAAVSRMQLERDLRLGLERDEFLVYYQPILSLASGELRGFEALIRWNRAKGTVLEKIVSPTDFIPVAEDTGLIVAMGARVLTHACQQLASWKAQHLAAANLTMSVNVSAKQLADDSLAAHLREVLLETGVSPASIRLEITESILMEVRGGMMERLHALKATGVLLSLDDFGTGYSSLSCLHQFPIDVLKVDRSFVQNLEGRRHASAVVHAVVNLAHDIGMEVIAEGIERLEQVAFLQTLDCDLGQGFLFSKPLTAKAAELFLLQSKVPTAAA